VLLVSLTMGACSLTLPLSLSPLGTTPTRTATLELTNTATPSVTPTLPTATFTFTPTLIGAKSPTRTALPVKAGTPVRTATPGTPTASLEMDGFTAIRLSTSAFYVRGCEPTAVDFTAQVDDTGAVKFVVLFTRFKSATTGATSTWTSLETTSTGGGTYTHRLTAAEILGLESFDDPWVQYQLVTADKNGAVLGRTQVFDAGLRLWMRCPSTPSATP